MIAKVILPALLLLVIACNDTPDKQPSSLSDTLTTATPVPDSLSPVTDPYALSPAEIEDDSVFSDGSMPTSWANAGFDNPLAFKKFLKHLQYWVATDQRDSVAAVVAYPLHHPAVKNAQQFLAGYDKYMREQVKKALKEQNLRQIFRRDQGAMIGNGELWFSETPQGFRIIGIN